MALMKWDPFAELDALHNQLNTLFHDNFSHMPKQQMSPTTDIYREDDKQITVEVHLPDFDEKEVNIDLHNNALEIKAEHTEKEEDKKKRHYMVRESSSSFYRRIALPKQADEENIKANFENGVLKVTVPLKALPQPKQIKIASKAESTKTNNSKSSKK